MELKINGNKIFAPLKNKELVLTPEERVRQEYICRLVNHYGYDLSQMEQELQVNNSHRGQGKARADIVVWKSASAKSNEDAATIHRLIGACNRIVTVEQTLYCYRQSANSIMRSSFSIRRTDNLSALADRIQYSYQHHWDNVFVVTANRYVCEFFDHYFLFPRNEENNKYFQRMDNSLRIALPYLLRSNTVSMQHKLYLILIRINPKLYTALRKLFS